MIFHVYVHTQAGIRLLFYPAKAEVISEPYGLVLIITPWNYPLRQSSHFHLHMLLASLICSSVMHGNILLTRVILFCWLLELALEPLIGAIAAGNVVVIKPSEMAPATSSFLANTIPLYLDSSAIKIIEGGSDTTQQLLQHQWDKIFYTGSINQFRLNFLVNETICTMSNFLSFWVKLKLYTLIRESQGGKNNHDGSCKTSNSGDFGAWR